MEHAIVGQHWNGGHSWGLTLCLVTYRYGVNERTVRTTVENKIVSSSIQSSMESHCSLTRPLRAPAHNRPTNDWKKASSTVLDEKGK